MRGRSSAYPEGVVDVSIIVPTCFENPLKEESISFLSDVLLQKRKTAIPVTALIGAYHIATRYLHIPRLAVKKVIQGILTSKSPALYPHVTAEIAADALDYATTYNIESWDGYLISLTRGLGSIIIYTLDMELSKIKEITVVNPFPQEKVKRYHRFLKRKLHER